MKRTTLHLIIDSVALGASLLTFGSGLVLFFKFHVGAGALQTAALGWSRLAWLDLHRLSAIAVLVSMTLHCALHWRQLTAKMRKAFQPGVKHAKSELLLYVAFWIVMIAGFIPWLAIEGSTPFFGPVLSGALPAFRHQWIDVHNISGLLALFLTVHHVGHRWRWMKKALLTWDSPALPPQKVQ